MRWTPSGCMLVGFLFFFCFFFSILKLFSNFNKYKKKHKKSNESSSNHTQIGQVHNQRTDIVNEVEARQEIVRQWIDKFALRGATLRTSRSDFTFDKY